MLVVAVKPAHDGAIAAVQDGRLLFSLEPEKDTFPRYSPLTPTTMLDIAEHVPEPPDVIAVSGWMKRGNRFLGHPNVGAGYFGAQAQGQWPGKFFGKDVTVFIDSHERSHIMMAAGMAPRDSASQRAVLVWEGRIGSFYLLDEHWKVVRDIPVMADPGLRYSFVYALADPEVPDAGAYRPRLDDAGKLMALAAYASGSDADRDVSETVERLLGAVRPWQKADFRDSPLHNAGVESDIGKVGAALITERIFEVFAAAAREQLPAGIPLYISGGCGLNCEWNVKWRELGHFSSVFVPPCTNDSGSALGTALDALVALTGDPRIDWSVYSGLDFVMDCEPDAGRWNRQPLEPGAVAAALGEGQILAWVQGRWEIGPRALGNRSILAEPFNGQTRDRLNELKKREGFRPIAPCCRIEDAGKAFDDESEDPYMLYFRRVRSRDLQAITHVDGTARVQTVSADGNRRLHELLSAFADRYGVGVLCNTSLNFKQFGFINRMSDLVRFCERQGLAGMVVGDTWYSRVDGQAG